MDVWLLGDCQLELTTKYLIRAALRSVEMILFRSRRRSFFKFFTSIYPIALVLAIVWGESLNYYYWRLFWNIPQSNSLESLGILIVADPQLVGFRNENHMIGPLTRWDCDRFLSKGFSHAVSVTKPDLIVFLGDLFDEGVEASESEIEWTLSRFKNIFFYSESPKIFISGDNDVGGEMEPVQSVLTTRFRNTFSNSFPASTLFNHLILTEVNLMNGEVHKISESSAFPNLNVVLSHISFGYSSYHDPEKMAEALKPDLILSGHDHKVSFYRMNFPFSFLQKYQFSDRPE
ncbi:hypothetical protein KIN20_005254 [Parelaphostrongylus tenuis]|uniref:Calcineurin-like phosphoesterase domain-containing protein n=1 Tax=Parelaphostrongylus tenuis TaxID=148309 RepID=A0AAD5MIL6_PARTN|nr:hypothetical protein KIN20_005254 [Parelaphostrongylus tenuis]